MTILKILKISLCSLPTEPSEMERSLTCNYALICCPHLEGSQLFYTFMRILCVSCGRCVAIKSVSELWVAKALRQTQLERNVSLQATWKAGDEKNTVNYAWQVTIKWDFCPGLGGPCVVNANIHVMPIEKYKM